MTNVREPMEQRLERLKVATRGLSARPDFAARVNAAALREAPTTGWFFDLEAAARRFVLVAAVAAVLGVIWAAHVERTSHGEQASRPSAELDLQW